MNVHLEQLIQLAKIDKEIDAFTPQEAKINADLNALLAQEKEYQSQIEDAGEEIDELRMKKSKNEVHLAELSDKLGGIDKKSNAAKSEKEVKALQLEEEIAREQIAFANEEIERLDKLEAAKQADIEMYKAKIGELTAAVEEAKSSSKTQITELEKQKKSTFEKKERLVSEIPQKVLSFYQKIRRWAGNATVVPVKKQACYGCHMKLNDKTYNEVIRSEEIITCPSCGRILFIAEEEASTEEG